MAIYKCKMCGGSLEVSGESSVATCEYCGSVQTLPKKNDEVITNLFNRANNLRIKCEFDKAADVYEKILNEDNNDSEAHWGLVLCKYGIEYVEDPKTYKRIPTCHRTQYESILTDVDYLAAVSNADSVSADIYKAQAEEIANLQKDILAIVKNEKPFDVFICYKETDENGKRTVDSTLANDIYYQLTQEGMKVFYAAITLEDKLGVEYEPYIFAALNSAKVMLVVGTKPEYFEAIWVKNEWSRYLKLMKEDRSKLLIPCYRDMDAYDLPEEFSHLQAQDMGKIGFVNDVVRGIKKVITSTESKTETVVKETVVTSSNTSTAPLLKRAFMFLEDGDWKSADEYCEKVLDFDPECAEAYLGKLMAEQKVKTCESLKEKPEPFFGSNNYQKAVRFGDDKLKKMLSDSIEHINTRNENIRLDIIYRRAKKAMSDATTDVDFNEAERLFKSIIEYSDSSSLAEKCIEKAEESRKDAILSDAKSKMELDTISRYEEAIELFKSISGWKDSDEKVISCQQKIELIKREDEEKRIQDEYKKKIRTKKMIIGSSIGVAIVAILIVLFTVIIPTINYNKADALLAANDYEGAMKCFAKIDNFKDAHAKYTEAFISLKNSYKSIADQLMNDGDHIQAAINYIKAGEPILAKYAYDFSSKLVTTTNDSVGVSNLNKLFYAKSRKNSGRVNIADISSIEDSSGYANIIGVDSSGNAIIHNCSMNSDLRETILSWKNIKQIEKEGGYTFALLNDGTVIGVFCNSEGDLYYLDDSVISSWKNIVEIGIYKQDLWAIDSNGQFYYTGFLENNNTCSFDLSDFSSIKKVQFGYGWLLGLTEEGKIVALNDRNDDRGILLPAEISNISQKVSDIIVSDRWIFVLHEDGTMVSAIFNDEDLILYDYSKCISTVRTGISNWSGIIYIQSVADGVIGEDIHGNVYFQSTSTVRSENWYVYVIENREDIKSTIEGWKDVVYISSDSWGYRDAETNIYLGLHADGTVSSFGSYLTFENVEDLYEMPHYDEVYDKVDSWDLW